MTDKVLSFKILKCQQRDHFTCMMTLIKKSITKKFIIYCNEAKVVNYFVDILDYLKVESTSDYEHFLKSSIKICFVDRTFDFDYKKVSTDYLIFFDLPNSEFIDNLFDMKDKVSSNFSVIFLVRECENEWVDNYLIGKLNAKELTLPKSALVDVESSVKIGTKKVFALQRDAQLAYKCFIASYASNGHCELKNLKLKEIANNFGLDIPPKINDFENLLNQTNKSENGTVVLKSKSDIEENVPRKLRKIR